MDFSDRASLSLMSRVFDTPQPLNRLVSEAVSGSAESGPLWPAGMVKLA